MGDSKVLESYVRQLTPVVQNSVRSTPEMLTCVEKIRDDLNAKGFCTTPEHCLISVREWSPFYRSVRVIILMNEGWVRISGDVILDTNAYHAYRVERLREKLINYASVISIGLALYLLCTRFDWNAIVTAWLHLW